MKNLSIFFLLPILFLMPAFCSTAQISEGMENNPALELNPQDVPYFSSGNPLEKLMEFNVFVPKICENAKINKKIASFIEQELSLIGHVVKLKSEDMRGFGAGVILNIQSAPVATADGTDLPILRTTLSLQTFVTIQKTNLNCFPRVWAINDFISTSIGLVEEEKHINSIKRVISEFSKNYKFLNPDQKKKPTFYFY